ncbi:Elongation of very long chain fatty acids protein 7 [Halocaridina rubra]|uniref:Elongation of very long chain fatty acids protein n=1 Tax=Halocaridina rubra TaxID=373956 RepID=A0AAN8X966_HALRR
MLNASYWYYFSKIVDYLDTVFFVLHKKYDHVSVLHVGHHALMPVNMWYGVRYQPGGHNSLMGFLNSIVHTIMYGYYFLAAMGPKVRPFLWWKKYLTSMQMIQFIVVIVHSFQDKSKANGVSSAHTSNGVANGHSNGAARGVLKGIPNGVSRRRGVPNSVADTAHKTIELCEKMAFRSQRGAI